MESNGVLVLGNGCWTTARSDILEPVIQGFTDGGLEDWLCFHVDQVLGQLIEKNPLSTGAAGGRGRAVLCL
jgi:hypothetical protein